MAQSRETTIRLAEISAKAQAIFKEIHSFNSVFRSLHKGINFSGHAVVIEHLENEVLELGKEMLAWPLDKAEARIRRIHWALVLAAVSALADLNDQLSLEFTGGQRSGDRARYRVISHYTNAMSQAFKLQKLLLTQREP